MPEATQGEGHLKPHQRESWDSWSSKWDELIHDWRNPHSVYYGSCTLHIADFLPKEGRALSLGCGTGDCELRLRREGLRIVSTDFFRSPRSFVSWGRPATRSESSAFIL